MSHRPPTSSSTRCASERPTETPTRIAANQRQLSLVLTSLQLLLLLLGLVQLLSMAMVMQQSRQQPGLRQEPCLPVCLSLPQLQQASPLLPSAE